MLKKGATFMFGSILKELRLEHGLTQAELAKAIGVVQGTIYFWEKEINEPTASFLISLAKFFSISIDELLGLNIEDEASKPLNDNLEILNLYGMLTIKQKKIALSIMKSLSEF